MNSSSKGILGTFAGLCALWDAYTTYGGMYQVAGSQLIALVFTLFVNGAVIISFTPVKSDFVKFILVIIVLTALACDAYTAYNGNMALMVNGIMVYEAKVGIAVGMTIISVGSSLLVSYLIFRD